METKKCPMCAEEILVEAIKCKHCGSMLNEEPAQVAPIPKQDHTATTSGTDIRNPRIGKGKILLGVPIMILGFIFFAAVDKSSGGQVAIAALILAVGAGLTIVGKLQNWWHWK